MTGSIDVHHHILPERYVREVGEVRVGAQGSSGRIPSWSVEDALRRMDAQGIAAAITSISSPGVLLEEPGARVALARWCNEFAFDLTRQHPGRFGLFATLPLPDVDASLRELEYARARCQADGVCLLTNYGGLYFDDAGFRPLFEALDRCAAVVFVHPTSPQNMPRVAALSPSTLEFPFDTTRAIAAIIFGGVAREFPRIRFIFSHAGGAMPYLAGRVQMLVRNNPRLQEYIPEGMNAVLSRMYFDTALSAHPAAFAALQQTVAAENILFGTDYPFGPPNQVEDAAVGLAGSDLSADEKRGIACENALRLFPRFQ